MYTRHIISIIYWLNIQTLYILHRNIYIYSSVYTYILLRREREREREERGERVIGKRERETMIREEHVRK